MSIIKCRCSSCNRINNHEVLFEEDKTMFEEDGGGWWEVNSYQVIKCLGCDTISFRIAQHSPETAMSGLEGQILYPKRDKNTISIKTFDNIPKNIRSIYIETIDALNNNLFILCCAGLRAIIEAVCNEKQIKNGLIQKVGGTKVKSSSLDGKIEGLVENGFLAKANANSLHELRFLGNAAVHSLEIPSMQELKIAIKIIENLIENVFEIEHNTKSLITEKEKRKKGK